MNLPNSLTVSRLVLTAAFVVAFMWDNRAGYGIALVTFVVAAITDFLAGYLARKLNLVTSLGKLLDPIADKVLTASAFIFLCEHGDIYCPAWVVVVILAREFLVTGLRLLASSQGAVLMADSLGKWKTVAQIAASTYYLIHQGGLNKEPFLLLMDDFIPSFAGEGLLGICVLLTIVSGLSYMRSNRHLIQSI